MPTPDQPNRRGARAIAITLLFGFVTGYLSCTAIQSIFRIRSEYEAAAAIRAITDFVASKERWPTSWAELNLPEQRRVDVHWSLDMATCDRYDAMTSIAPATSGFYTYPHAESQLAELWQVIQQARQKRASQEAASSRK